MKIKLSKRWFADFLIVLFGLLILAVAIFTSWKIWLASADNYYLGGHLAVTYSAPTFETAGEVPTYRIHTGIVDNNGVSHDFLEVFSAQAIDSIVGGSTVVPPAYKLVYLAGNNSYTMAVVPLTNYDYSQDSIISTTSTAYRLLNYGKSVASGDDAGEIDAAVSSYQTAIGISNSVNSSAGGVSVAPQNGSVSVGTAGTNIGISVDTSKIDPSQIDHISVFATAAGKTFAPNNDDAGRQSICDKASANPPTTPLASLLGQTTCTASGNCGSVQFNAPSTAGAHQIFAVAMKNSTACNPSNILGWSGLDNSLINVFQDTVQSGSNVTVSFHSPVVVDEPFAVSVLSQNPNIDHISIFVAKVGAYDWASIDDTTVCREANAEDQSSTCKLCLQDKVPCAGGVCQTAKSTNITLKQSGEHRVVAVAVSNTSRCTASGANRNIIAINKEGIISVVSPTDHNGDGNNDVTGGADGGTGGNGGGGNNGGGGDNGGTVANDWLTNFAHSPIKTLGDLLKHLGGFSLIILAVFAVLAIIIAGMKYITAGGDPKKAETGKKAVLYSVYGIVLVVLVIELITLTVTEVRKIVGNKLPDPSQTKRIISPNIGGPLATINDVINHSGGLIWSIIRLAVYYSEFVAAFYILYASFLYMTSFGDDSKAESAKKTLIWAVIGLAFIISVNTLLSVFAGVLL